MVNDVFTFLVGGKAGEGVKKAGSVVAHIFSSMGQYVFQMDDYMSLIRGGHNFSMVSTSTRWITSHYMKADLLVNFDKRSCETHINDVADGGIVIYNSDEQEDIDGIGIPFSSEAEKYPMKNLMYGVGAVAILASISSKFCNLLCLIINGKNIVVRLNFLIKNQRQKKKL